MIEKVLEINMLLDFYGNLLSLTQQKSMMMYYVEDFSLSEIADELLISKQAVSDNLKRGERNLKIFEEKLKLFEKHKKKMALKEEINTCLSNIDFNQLSVENREIMYQLKELIEKGDRL